jgi:hypothetical protein
MQSLLQAPDTEATRARIQLGRPDIGEIITSMAFHQMKPRGKIGIWTAGPKPSVPRMLLAHQLDFMTWPSSCSAAEDYLKKGADSRRITKTV